MTDQPENQVDDQAVSSGSSLMLKEVNQARFPDLAIDEIKLNLKTLSMLKEGDKLCIRGNFLEIDNSTSFTRTVNSMLWDGYSREDIIDFIIHLTEECLRVSDEILYRKDDSELNKFFKQNISDTIKSMSDEMRLSLVGLRNIKLTYSKDSAIQARLDLVIEKIENRIKQINESLKLYI